MNTIQINKIQSKKIGDVDSKIPDTSCLVTTNVLNPKISETENKIPNTRNLVTTDALNPKVSEAENKISNHDKYIITPEFRKLTAEHFTARLKQANLLTKTNFDNKLKSFNKQKKLQVMMDFKLCLFINQHLVCQS